jgi:hypothetical protein
MRRLGVLMGNHSNDPVGQALAAALVQGLGALDWHRGDNLQIEWRWAGGDPALFQRYAAELVALSPEAILKPAPPIPLPLANSQAFRDPIELQRVKATELPPSESPVSWWSDRRLEKQGQ